MSRGYKRIGRAGARLNGVAPAWSKDAIATLRLHRRRGKTIGEIAILMDRSRGAIAGKIMRLRLPKLKKRERERRYVLGGSKGHALQARAAEALA